MAKTPHLALPYLAPAQAQKHVTVNEGLAALDSVVHCAVREVGRDNPPPDAAEGDRYLVGDAPTGAWAGKARRLAAWRNGGWAFHAPRPGWRLYNLADDTFRVLDTAMSWVVVGGQPSNDPSIQNANFFGLGTTADATSPFAAKLNAALWTARSGAEGGTGDLVVTMNKGAWARDLGHVFQTNNATKAVVGLFGSNNFRISVTADGTEFADAILVENQTGVVDQPRLPRFKAFTNFDNYAAVDAWTKIAINEAEYNDQGAFDAGSNRFVAPAVGSYLFGASLLYKVNANSNSRMRARLVLNGATEIRGSMGEISGNHVSERTALWLQTMVALGEGDTVELQGTFRATDGYFAADHTTFWGCKVG